MWLTIDVLSEYLSISKSHATHLCRSGDLPAIKDEKDRWRVKLEDAESRKKVMDERTISVTVEEIHAAWAETKSLKRAARVVGLSADTVRRKLLAAGHDTSKGVRRPSAIPREDPIRRRDMALIFASHGLEMGEGLCSPDCPYLAGEDVLDCLDVGCYENG